MHIFADLAKRFGGEDSLALSLFPHSIASGKEDGAHDYAHLMRVWVNALAIMQEEGGDRRIMVAAVLLHDSVAVEKNSPMRKMASRLAAEKANDVLADMGWTDVDRRKVCHAIEAHSHSAGIEPESLEACILQDADRLDAIGLIGAARCFYVAGRMGSVLYDVEDVTAAARELDDVRFALDHFPAKLFRLSSGFRTRKGASLARERHNKLKIFYNQLIEEVG